MIIENTYKDDEGWEKGDTSGLIFLNVFFYYKQQL